MSDSHPAPPAMRHQELTEDEFLERFRPIANHLNDT